MNRSPIHWMVPAAAAFLAMLLAVLVRIPPVFSVEQMAHTDSLIDKEGRPYFLQPDAYYHVRMGDEIAKKGYFGVLPDQGGKVSGRSFVNIPLCGLIMLVVWIAPCIYAINLEAGSSNIWRFRQEFWPAARQGCTNVIHSLAKGFF